MLRASEKIEGAKCATQSKVESQLAQQKNAGGLAAARSRD